MFEKILLPLDGSMLSEKSIPHALEFARIFNSSIYLLQVLEPESNTEKQQYSEPLNWQLLKARAELYMHNVANQLRSALDLPQLENEPEAGNRVTVTILEGKIAENIVDFAHKECVDLLVICTHGSGGLSRWNMNSTTTKVINLIYIPVLIIRGYQVEDQETGMPEYKRIVLPFDCSRRSESSLNPALTIAKYKDSHLFLVTVIRPPEIPSIEPFDQQLQQLSDKFMDLSRVAVQNYISRLSIRVAHSNETRILENHNIVQAVMNVTRDEKADLLVFCAHGQTGELTWPFGAVARGFVEYSSKPVLVIQDLNYSQAIPTDASQAADLTRSRE